MGETSKPMETVKQLRGNKMEQRFKIKQNDKSKHCPLETAKQKSKRYGAVSHSPTGHVLQGKEWLAKWAANSTLGRDFERLFRTNFVPQKFASASSAFIQ